MPVENLHRWTESARFLSLELESHHTWILLGLLFVLFLAVVAGRKLATLLLTLRAVALVPMISRGLSKWVKTRDYSDDEFLRADGAATRWIELRERAIDRLAGVLQAHSAKSIAWGNEIRESFSDLRFTDANRVPFPFMRLMRERGTAVGTRYSKENASRGRVSSDSHHTFSDSGVPDPCDLPLDAPDDSSAVVSSDAHCRLGAHCISCVEA